MKANLIIKKSTGKKYIFDVNINSVHQLLIITFRSIFFSLIILHYFPAIGQNSQSEQWQSVGGQLLLTGKHHFAESWTSSPYSRDKGLYWNGGYYDAEEKRNYQPWENTVQKSVAPNKGQITVLGPGNVGLYQKGKGARIHMIDVETKARFTPWVNTISWSGSQWSGSIKEYNKNGEFWGSVPAGKEVTIDISAVMDAYNNVMNTGEYAFYSPQEVEYEIWFFPREGSKVKNVTKNCKDDFRMDVTDVDKQCPEDIQTSNQNFTGSDIQTEVPPKGQIMDVVDDPIDPSSQLTGTGYTEIPSNNWSVNEDVKLGLTRIINYLNKRAQELKNSNPQMSELLTLYAKRIPYTHIYYDPSMHNGKASTSRFLKNITLYGQLVRGNSVFDGKNATVDKLHLSQATSALIHEIAHVYWANEWQAHYLQKVTFDALEIPIQNEIEIQGGYKIITTSSIREDNDKFFKKYPKNTIWAEFYRWTVK